MYFELFYSSNKWWWRYKAANHEEICRSTDGYWHRQDALTSIGLVQAHAAGAQIYAV